MRRILGSLGAATLLAVFSVATTHGQLGTRGAGPVVAGAAAKGYVQPKTPDGQPDLTGFWTNATFTPLQRPNTVQKESYTLEEVIAAEKAAAAREDEQTVPGTEDDLHYDGTQFALGKTQSRYARNLRTSLITDPPDGRIPPLNDQGKQRLAQREADRKAKRIFITNRTELNSIVGPNGRYDSAENNSLDDRCIITGQPGPPMVPGGYNSGFQFVQSPGWLMILTENMHIARMIPTDGRPGLPQSVRGWTGVSRGRWEGNTLVVETTNFNDKGWIATNAAAGRIRGVPHSEALRLVERFARVDADTISYEVTVEDPNVYTGPWTVKMPLNRDESYQIYEYACHEGNRAIENILTAARVADAQAAGKK